MPLVEKIQYLENSNLFYSSTQGAAKRLLSEVITSSQERWDSESNMKYK